MANTYSAADLIDKTFIATGQVKAYDYPDDSYAPNKIFSAGDTVGVLYSWVGGKNTKDPGLWWMFWPETPGGIYLYVKHNDNLFDLSAFSAQGVKSEEQKIADLEYDNLPWYQKLIKDYGLLVIGGLIIASSARGYFSRPAKK